MEHIKLMTRERKAGDVSGWKDQPLLKSIQNELRRPLLLSLIYIYIIDFCLENQDNYHCYYTVNTNVQRSLNSNQRSAEFPPSNTRYYSAPLSTQHIFSEIDNFIFDNAQNYCELKNDFTDVEGSFARNKIQLENLSKSLEYRYLSALCPSIALHHPVLYQHKHQVNVKRLFLPWLVSPLQLLSSPGLTLTNNHFTALIFYIVT